MSAPKATGLTPGVLDKTAAPVATDPQARAAEVLCRRDDTMFHHERTDDFPCWSCKENAAALAAAGLLVDPARLSWLEGRALDAEGADAARAELAEVKAERDYHRDHRAEDQLLIADLNANRHKQKARAEQAEAALGAVLKAATHPHKGPNDTDASMLLAAAKRLDGGYDPGGSHTKQTVARVCRAVAAVLKGGDTDV